MTIVVDSSQGDGISVHPDSSVAGTTVTLVPRLTVYEQADGGGGGVPGWGQVMTRLTGCAGVTPTIKVSKTGIGYFWPWQPTEAGYFSYNRLDWTAMGNAPVIDASYITCSHSAPFAQDEVWFARSRHEGVYQVQTWVAALSAQYPTLMTDVIGGSGFVADTFSSQTDELSRTVIAMPLLAFWVTKGLSSRKKKICLTSGTHATESWSTTVYKKAIEWLLSSESLNARRWRATFDTLCLPLTNAPGRDGGHQRAQFQVIGGFKNDTNRHFSDVTTFETVSKNRAVIEANISAGTLAVGVDWHMYSDNSDRQQVTYYSTACPLFNAFNTAMLSRLGSTTDDGPFPVGSISDYFLNTQLAPLALLCEYGSGSGYLSGTPAGHATMAVADQAAQDTMNSIADVVLPTHTGSMFARA